jgi:hypothetical protein
MGSEKVSMIYLLVFLLLGLSLVFTKYIIDTKSTIKELRSDRDRYRELYWKAYVNKDSRQKLNWLYGNIKDQMSELIKDLKDTDFNNYDGNIKYEILEALKNIDDYSTTIENQDMDSFLHYKEKDGKVK